MNFEKPTPKRAIETWIQENRDEYASTLVCFKLPKEIQCIIWRFMEGLIRRQCQPMISSYWFICAMRDFRCLIRIAESQRTTVPTIALREHVEDFDYLK